MLRKQVLALAILLAGVASAQPARPPLPPNPAQPDAQNTRRELADLFRHYPPNLQTVLALDPGFSAIPPTSRRIRPWPPS